MVCKTVSPLAPGPILSVHELFKQYQKNDLSAQSFILSHIPCVPAKLTVPVTFVGLPILPDPVTHLGQSHFLLDKRFLFTV